MSVVDEIHIRNSNSDVVESHTRSKRQRLASLMVATGTVRILEKFPQRNCLVVLNYHRIGSTGNTAGDPNLYSATSKEFDEQVRWLKRNYHISSLDEAIAFVEGKETFRRTGILLTFDDGYKDNYEYAFPVLQKHRAQATFFICTSYIGSSQLPWWDQIAYMLKNSKKSQIALDYPERLSFHLGGNWMQVLDHLLTIYKSGHELDKGKFLREIAAATGMGDHRPNERIFIDKDELKEMSENGMAIGSHTHTHPLLSHLSQDEQLEEVVSSKRMLEENLGIDIKSLAYPVGAPDSFDGRTQEALRKAGYRIAFSFYGGSNVPGRTNPYDVRRHHVGIRDGEALFRVRTSTAAVMGSPLF